MISVALVYDIWTRGCGSGVLRWRCVTRFINKGRGVLHCTIRGHEEWRVCQHPPRIEIDCLEIDVSEGSNNNLKLEKVIITYTRTKEAPILSQFTEDSKDIRYQWLKIATNNLWPKDDGYVVVLVVLYFLRLDSKYIQLMKLLSVE